MTTTVAAAVARSLAAAGIDRVFGLPGGEVLVLIDELRKAGVDFVLMRHEANAGLAAAVYGKLKGTTGVALATLGPGAANLLLPVSNAYLDQEPLLAISAQIPSEFPAAHTHQLLPLQELYEPVCRYVDTITASNCESVVSHALAATRQRPFAVSYLTLSARDAVKPVIEATAGGSRSIGGLKRAPGDPPAQAARLRDALAAAERPLVVVGLGADSSIAPRLRQWIESWNLPVAVTPKVKGIVDETTSNFVGVVSGMAADGLLCEALEAADLRIGFGLDPVEVDKTWHAELPIHWVLDAPNVTERVPPGTELVDHALLLNALLSSGPAPRAWGAPFAAFQQRRRALLDGSSQRGTIWPGDIIRALAGAAPADTIVTTDVGSHKYLFGQFWPSRVPDTFWMSNGLSGMAYGISAALGASLARPKQPVLAAVGDGGFSMNAQELETAARVGARFVTVVLEDGSYSLIKLAQENRQLAPYRMDFGPIDTVKMAEACGVAAVRTTKPAELADAAASALADRRNLVIAVPVDYSDYRKLF
jgi:acetolactate synthase-1/2/3 large subunit